MLKKHLWVTLLIIILSFIRIGRCQDMVIKKSHLNKLAKQVHAQTSISLYCQLPLDDSFHVIHTNPFLAHQAKQACRFLPIIPLEVITSDLSCWHHPCRLNNKVVRGGKRCCQANSIRFQQIASDLHNIAPIEPFFSGKHHHQRLARLNDDFLFHHPACQFKMNLKSNEFEPSDRSKGVFARSYLYLHDTYHIVLSPKLLAQLKQWHLRYPPEPWEVFWAQAVERIQGTTNYYRTPAHG